MSIDKNMKQSESPPLRGAPFKGRLPPPPPRRGPVAASLLLCFVSFSGCLFILFFVIVLFPFMEGFPVGGPDAYLSFREVPTDRAVEPV